jgi:hypothetical protein
MARHSLPRRRSRSNDRTDRGPCHSVHRTQPSKRTDQNGGSSQEGLRNRPDPSRPLRGDCAPTRLFRNHSSFQTAQFASGPRSRSKTTRSWRLFRGDRRLVGECGATISEGPRAVLQPPRASRDNKDQLMTPDHTPTGRRLPRHRGGCHDRRPSLHRHLLSR